MRRVNADMSVNCEYKGTNIKRRTLGGRNPVLIDKDKLADSFNSKLLINQRYAQTLV
jgi:hypothetical protein